MRENNRFNKRLLELREVKDILIASHRGYVGVSVIDNTIESFEIALNYGADILEMDISMSTDEELFVIHDGMESRLFQIMQNVQTLPAARIRELEYYTLNHNGAGVYPNTFDEVLEHLKDRCLINLDKCWAHKDEQRKWRNIFNAVERHGMEDQIIFKSAASTKYAKMFAGLDKPYMYMPMLDTVSQIEPFLNPSINMVAAEMKFRDESEEMAQPEVRHNLKKRGIMLWGNALTLGGNHILAAGHDDRAALAGDPDFGWGYFVDQGYDIVQTDHLPGLIAYYRGRNIRV